jgi:hypothetical protein
MATWRQATAAVFLSVGACAGVGPELLEDVLSSALPGPGLDEATIADGLREALRVGTENAVQATSRPDGFFGDVEIRIPLPEEMSTAASALRTIGFDSKVDELEVTMNRAAERAAAESSDIFMDAILALTFADAREILDGDDRAATTYLRGKTADRLRVRFSPIVDAKMREVGLVRFYDDLIVKLDRVPFVSRPDLDLADYVTRKTLDGLFTVLAREEGRIRTDPAARVNDLLRTVFGS